MVASMHPQAKFDPIPPDLDLHNLVDQTQNFKWAQRVSREQIRSIGQEQFEKLVQLYVIEQGRPLVVEGWNTALPKPLFTAGWLEQTYDKKQENVRDIGAGSDLPMTTGHYLRSMKQLTNQWTPTNFRDERRQRLYLKDIDCPPEWHEALKKLIHPSLFYMNDNVTVKRHGRKNDDDDDDEDESKPAIAGDLMSSLPEEMRAQNLMCYIGHEGTYTPAHREMCASLGQNIMVEASGDQNGEKPGSSIWFMTESNDRAVVREYFLSMLGHDIEIEKHFAQTNAWKRAPFDVYIVEQKPGDFILIPPLAAHQVWNRGTRTMKVAWNRTTVDTLALALHEALPKARLVCRDEQYKNKAIIYYTAEKYGRLLHNMDKQADITRMGFLDIGQDIINTDPHAKQLFADFKKLVALFAEILVDEMFALKEREPEFIAFDSCITCSYCRSNIFNRFMTCKHCIRPLLNGDEDTYDVCMECYAMGRSCACISGLQWCEQWKWSDLVDKYEAWRALVIKMDGYIDIETSPQPLEVARLRSGRRSVAEICQEALKRRPWKDITKPEREKTPSDSEPDGPDGKPKKKKSRKPKRGEVRRCHVCCHRDYAYRVHLCTNPGCNEGYCYGVLYRAFDMMPQTVLADENWQCPKCLGICNCGSCRRSGNTDPYTPKNTSLGHDTRPIADDRSVETLVDFRVHNLSWLKAAGEESRSKDSKRMQRLREQAEQTKASQEVQEQEADANGDEEHTTVDGHVNTATNGYGDQSHILGGVEPGAAEYAEAASAQLEHEANAGRHASTAQPDITMDDSLYPDPTTLATQRIGMGYYEQDDTPDAILFDSFQAPPPETMAYDQSHVSEWNKTLMRALKRKERKAKEDPEFMAPRNHSKKPRLAKPADPLDAMDPALFSQPEISVDSAALPITPSTAIDHQPTGADSGATSASAPAGYESASYGFRANEPALRHAKPEASYLEPEDMDVDAIEAMLRHQSPPVHRVVSPRGSPDPSQSNKTAAELASDAVRALIKNSSATPTTAKRGPGRPPGLGSTGKRRGRPPKQATVTVEASEPTASASTAPERLPKRRGRPPKARVMPVESPKEAGMAEDAEEGNSDTDADIAELHEELGRSLAADEEAALTRTRSGRRRRRSSREPGPSLASDELASQRTRSGRPQRSGVSADPAKYLDRMDIDNEEREDEDTEDVGEVIKPSPKKRGRPRRSEAPDNVVALPRQEEPNVGDTSFMSMKERMALRGKSFKVRGKKPGRGGRSFAGSRESEPTVSTHAAAGNSNAGPEGDSDSDKSPTPPRSLAAARATARHSEVSDGYQSSSSASSIEAVSRHGPTVVRLADAPSDSDDDPVFSTGVKARGGAARARGRGGGRGRGRGRSRGQVF
ncbi:hypothetical protein NLU13_3587 [Sarocladium strictum]|uniref:JmjC domain-containing protein n=1 Tax=Sarocladium strictum TaxID=5046 RepID=A0AA39GN29_SARSR|nr:hypothetical protein NLU13_3587 [Sarocladium strictum]